MEIDTNHEEFNLQSSIIYSVILYNKLLLEISHCVY